MLYDAKLSDKKWQQIWEKSDAFKLKQNLLKQNYKNNNYYVLEMLPYTSGSLHMGHVSNYTIGDIIARFKTKQGLNVLHPIGWDAFGLPAENAARNNGLHPWDWTFNNINEMKKELKTLGFSYDWSREIATANKEYYIWEQKLFIQLYNKNIAYRKNSKVNWCNECKTVLANEQVEDGLCWRCSSEVQISSLQQWFLRISNYAQELLDGLDTLKQWPQRVIQMQRNWIGRSSGANVVFKLKNPTTKQNITTFTTRPDTLYGVTFLSLSINYKELNNIITPEHKDDVSQFIAETKAENAKQDRKEKEQLGVFTGSYAIHPLTGNNIPIYVANYVLDEYGSGALMGVPAHDHRDYGFANKYHINIVPVIAPPNTQNDDSYELPYTEHGTMVNSQQFNGQTSQQSADEIVRLLESKGLGNSEITYRLHDWGISRQRYWGTPIPMIHCDSCGIVPVALEDLPVVLPKDVSFEGDGNPLDRHEEFVNTTCPKCQAPAKRETDTMDTFINSSWYFLRYCDPNNDQSIFDKNAVDSINPVDTYVGGVEHAVMHLLYSRFFVRILRDLGYLSFDEPFKHLITQGMVCMTSYKCPNHSWLYPHEVDNDRCVHCQSVVTVGRAEKMSKSKNNVVNPKEIMEQHGVDSCRLFTMFAGPVDKDIQWSQEGIEGMKRFLGRVYTLVVQNKQHVQARKYTTTNSEISNHLLYHINYTIKKVTNDIESVAFNTAIAAIMELVNVLYKVDTKTLTNDDRKLFGYAVHSVIELLSPFAPHICEELNEIIDGHTDSYQLICKTPWLKYDDSHTTRNTVTIGVQINGKMRSTITVATDASEDEAVKHARQDSKILGYIDGDGSTLVKTIYIKGRILNFIVK